MPVVTLSGALGAGAIEVGPIVAERLGIEYIDREILVAAARSLSVSPEDVAIKEMSTSRWGSRLSRLLRSFIEQSARAGSWDPLAGDAGLEFLLGRTYAEAAALPAAGHWLDDETYIRTIRSIVLDIAGRRQLVLVGRGGQAILRDFPRALHALLVCPKGLRISRVAEREGLSIDDARKRVAESEKARVSFHKKYFKIAVDDPQNYHIVIDTSRFSYGDTAEILCAAARLQAPHVD